MGIVLIAFDTTLDTCIIEELTCLAHIKVNHNVLLGCIDKTKGILAIMTLFLCKIGCALELLLAEPRKLGFVLDENKGVGCLGELIAKVGK